MKRCVNFGALTNRGQEPLSNISYDPHRLQISYGQHAMSLNTVRDFYLDQNSAMEYYQRYQWAWITERQCRSNAGA